MLDKSHTSALALELRNCSKYFGETRALDDVSFTVPAGQMVGVIGPSGAGKSTLLRMINRLADPTSGSILFDGQDIGTLRGRALRRWRARCAMVFQQFGLVKRSDVVTNVLLGRLNHKPVWQSLPGIFTKAERLRALETLARFSVDRFALQRADTLSGGQQQRVAIAKALMQDPQVILADEPVASLDPKSTGQVMDALRKINREDGLIVLCNLHNVQLARDYCDRIIAMQDGGIVFDGPPAELTPDRVRAIYGMDLDADDDDHPEQTLVRLKGPRSTSV